MKPHTICHMVASVDGRILHDRWRPAPGDGDDPFEMLHDRLGGGTWIVGRTTGAEFAQGDAPYPDTDERFERTAWLPVRDAASYGVVLDRHGKIAFGRADIGSDPIVAVLSESVSDAHLAGLRADGVGYVFGGADDVDLAAVLEMLNAELGVERVMIEGGGTANGAFLRAGLVDELSLAIYPAIDGACGAPSVFHSHDADDGGAAPVAAMSLTSCERLDGGIVWLRYRLENG